jgi:phenylalanyl-tRNA synthetase beta chain
VDVDLALVVDEDFSYEQLVQRISSAGGKLLRDVRLFDVYRDPVRVGVGKKSMAFSLTYRADDHTLTSEEVDKVHSRLLAKVLKSTGGEVRS